MRAMPRSAAADIVIHLAGANRPERADDFLRINRDLSACRRRCGCGGRTTARSSSTPPRRRRRATATMAVASAPARRRCWRSPSAGAAQVLVYRLPNVFGKWARPNYNSAVATFCHNLARGLPISVKAEAPIQLALYRRSDRAMAGDRSPIRRARAVSSRRVTFMPPTWARWRISCAASRRIARRAWSMTSEPG